MVGRRNGPLIRGAPCAAPVEVPARRDDGAQLEDVVGTRSNNDAFSSRERLARAARDSAHRSRLSSPKACLSRHAAPAEAPGAPRVPDADRPRRDREPRAEEALPELVQPLRGGAAPAARARRRRGAGRPQRRILRRRPPRFDRGRVGDAAPAMRAGDGVHRRRRRRRRRRRDDARPRRTPPDPDLDLDLLGVPVEGEQRASAVRRVQDPGRRRARPEDARRRRAGVAVQHRDDPARARERVPRPRALRAIQRGSGRRLDLASFRVVVTLRRLRADARARGGARGRGVPRAQPTLLPRVAARVVRRRLRRVLYTGPHTAASAW